MVYVLKSMSPEKMDTDEGERNVNVIRRSKRDTVLNERSPFVFNNGSLKRHIRHPRNKLHHRNFDNIVQKMVTAESKENQEEEIMKNNTSNQSASKIDEQGMDKLASLRLYQSVVYANSDANGTISSPNAANNMTELVKIIRLTSMRLHLPVLLAFLFIFLLLVSSVMYACYFCICWLWKTKEREKERPLKLI